MTNREVVQAFVRGEKGKSGSLKSTGDKLFSYQTAIAQRVVGNGELLSDYVINTTKYSVTTSRHQSLLRRELGGTARGVRGVPCGVDELLESNCERN